MGRIPFEKLIVSQRIETFLVVCGIRICIILSSRAINFSVSFALPLRSISSLMLHILEYIVRIFHASLPPKRKMLESCTRPGTYSVPTCVPCTY